MTHRAIAPGPLARAVRGLAALLATTPSSRAAARLRAELEHLLMRVLAHAGPRGLAGIMRRVTADGLPVPLVESRPGFHGWAADVPTRGARFTLRVGSSRAMRYVSLAWSPLPPRPPALTPSQQARRDIQEAFYARYLAAGQRAYATRPRPLSRAARTILLIGELEADVNNGGFARYLDNKGRRRAAAALRALRAVGAEKTARLLEQAILAAATPEALSRLDDRFYRGAEDLAFLTMVSLRPRASTTGARRTGRRAR